MNMRKIERSMTNPEKYKCATLGGWQDHVQQLKILRREEKGYRTHLEPGKTFAGCTGCCESPNK
jgi:hypothetical protein